MWIMESNQNDGKTLDSSAGARRYWLERMKLAKAENELRALLLELLDAVVAGAGYGAGELGSEAKE